MVAVLLPMLVAGASSAWAETPRAAVVVGADKAPPGRAPLRFAHEDALAVSEALVELAGFEADRVTVLLDPDPEELLAAVRALEGQLGLLYYSGHADGEALFPHGRELPMAALREALEASGADFRLGVLDTCRGGGWTGARGITEVEPFPVEPGPVLGAAYLAASSGAEDAHEADRFRGGVFTHHWIAGLRGGADADGDGQVTLSESFAHARKHTIRDSTVLAGSAQHPSLHVDLQGRGDLVIADLRGATTTLWLEELGDPVSVHDLDDGLHVADVEPGLQQVVLPPGRYLLRRSGALRVEVAEVELRAGATARVSPADFSVVSQLALATKGDSARAALTMAPERGVWTWQVGMGSLVGPDSDGELQRLLAMRSSVQVGLGDRISLSLPAPGLGLRLGQASRHELLLHGGFTSGGYSLWPGPVAVLGDLGVNADARIRLSRAVSVGVSTALSSNSQLSIAGASFARTPRASGFTGLQLDLGSHVTLYPAVGVRHALEGGSTWLQLGSGLTRGPRHMPLLQVHATNGVSLDADLSVSVEPSSGDLYEQATVGVTLSFPHKRVQ